MDGFNRLRLAFTRPGKPTDNGFSESFNGHLRDEYLKVREFRSMEEPKRIIEAWRCDYNENRPHSSFGNLIPSECLKQGQRNTLKVAKLKPSTFVSEGGQQAKNST